MEKPAIGSKWCPVGVTDRCALGRSPRPISVFPDLSSAISAAGSLWHDDEDHDGTLSATPHEVTLAMSTLLNMVVADAPQNLIGDNAYDSDRRDTELRSYGIEVIAPHRRNRRASTQDGRRLWLH